MSDGYSAPPPLAWDPSYEQYNPFITDQRLTSYNAESLMPVTKAYIEMRYENYRGNHLMIPMGTDFAFTNAKSIF
jgi:hypothetical protein